MFFYQSPKKKQNWINRFKSSLRRKRHLKQRKREFEELRTNSCRKAEVNERLLERKITFNGEGR